MVRGSMGIAAGRRADAIVRMTWRRRSATRPFDAFLPAGEKMDTDYRESRPDIPVNRAFTGDIYADSTIRGIGQCEFNGV